MAKASHVSGYVNQRDIVNQVADREVPGNPLKLVGEMVTATAVRELSEIGLSSLPSPPKLKGTVPFYYFDKENLFFFLFEQQVPAWTVFNEAVHMFPWSLDELVQVRHHQVILNALKLLTRPMSEVQKRRASRILALNLTAHGEPGLSTRFDQWASGGTPPTDLDSALEEARGRTVSLKYSAGREFYVDGLAGLQYRIFFSHLVPAYAEIGVPGAAQLLEELGLSTERSAAIRKLGNLYHDEHFMASVPIEV
jgi:hypothetical protein